MAQDWGFISGNWHLICDVCGKKIRASESKKRWDGFIVCPDDWETRQPQDFIRVTPDNISVPFSRPEPEDTYIGLTGAIVGQAIVGRAIVGEYTYTSDPPPDGSFNITDPIGNELSFANVVFLNHFDVAPIGINVITNSAVGTGSGVDTNNFKFGPRALNSTSGAGSAEFLYQAVDLSSITNDFTIEGWIWSDTGDNFIQIFNNGNTLALVEKLGTTIRIYLVNDTGGVIYDSSVDTGISFAYEHIALVRKDNVFTLYSNGVDVLQIYSADPLSFNSDLSGEVFISVGSAGDLSASIDEVRITDKAVYTENFTPPTAPFSDNSI